MAKTFLQQKAQMFLDRLEDEELQAWFQRVLQKRAKYDSLVVRMRNGKYKSPGYFTPPGT